ncbi:MAG: hypothetical protein CMD81_09925 [Gammaproteobacteria bacterium]|nr:hypothetical protein [Gammaproteobacteria bacterium]HBF08157.1 hypothetical protein [Gammaproteobacteria bacterium]|tara:strand:- start:61918 stop:62214 length:297 start_codon:yes stop_codon:yes gene_type:complete
MMRAKIMKEITPNSETVWSFPAEHNVKAIGFSHHPVGDVFENILKEMKLSYKPGKTPAKKSSSGKYLSVTFNITFNSEAEVKTLYASLHAHPQIVQSL